MMKNIIWLIILLGCSLVYATAGSGVSGMVTLDTAPPVVSVLAPTGGIYQTGEPVNLSWNATDSHPQGSPIRVEWRDADASGWQNVAAFEPNDGAYIWNAPTAYTEHARLQVTMTDAWGNSSSSYTPDFTILPGNANASSAAIRLDTVDPLVQITCPTADSVFVRGDPLPIFWSITETNETVSGLNLDWQRRSTADWVNIATHTANDGTYTWVTPADSTAFARVRAGMTDAFGNYGADVSDAFTILQPMANFAADLTFGYVPLSVQFTDHTIGTVVAWAWDFDNDGVVDSRVQNPLWTYVFPWQATVSLTVTFADGRRQTSSRSMDSETKTAYIQPTINPALLHTVSPGGSIQSAINAASNGDYIIVADGSYFENLQIIGKEITLASQYFIDGDTLHIDNTVIDGSASRNRSEASVIAIRPGTNPGLSSQVVGFTITHGGGRTVTQTQGGMTVQKIVGGGIYIESNNPILTYNKVIENDADDEGGGSYAFQSLPNMGGLVTSDRLNPGGNVFRQNRADVGKDIYVDATGIRDVIQAENCDFSVFCAQDTTVTAYWTTTSAPIRYAGSSGRLATISSDIWVATDGSDTINNGLSATSPFLTIDHALSLAYGSAAAPITIHLAPGTYAPSQTGERYPLQMVNWVSLVGAGADETFLDAEATADMPGRVINLDKVTGCQIRDLSVQGGVVTAAKGTNGAGVAGYDSELQLSGLNCSGLTAAGDGAGIYLLNSQSVCDNLNVTSNNAENNGGGIYIGYGTATLNNSSVSLNSAHYGGGMYVTNCDFHLNDSAVSDNQTTGTQRRGGGIFLNASDDSRLTGNTVGGNIADFGAGIYLQGATNLQLNRNRIVNNLQNTTLSANGGGGLYWNNTTSGILTNNLIANNTAYQGGAGFGLSALDFRHNTIANNRATYKGGGFYLNACSPSYLNSILWGNTAASGGNQIYLQTNSSDPGFRYCDVSGGSAAFGLSTGTYNGVYQNNLNTNPLFTSPTTGVGVNYDAQIADWSLQTTSPCRDTGDPLSVVTDTPLDLAGNPRISNSTIDLGAVEYQVIQSVDSPQNVQIAVSGTSLEISWDAVVSANSYKVFTDTDPTGAFNTEVSAGGAFGSSVERMTWTTTITADTKQFFCVKANTGGVPSRTDSSFNSK